MSGGFPEIRRWLFRSLRLPECPREQSREKRAERFSSNLSEGHVLEVPITEQMRGMS